MANLLVDFLFAGAQILHLRLPPREHIKWLQPALMVARLLNNQLVVVYSSNMAVNHLAFNDPPSAIKLLEQAQGRGLGQQKISTLCLH